MDWDLRCGRAQDLLPGDLAGAVDLCVTSPPYDALRSYGGHVADFDFPAIADAIVASLADGGILVWVCADQIIDGGESLTSFRQAIHFVEQCGLRMHQSMIYQRWSINGMTPNRYFREHEHMFVLSKGAPKTANMLTDRQTLHPGNKCHKGWGGRDKNDELHYDYSDHYRIGEQSKRSSIWRYTSNWTADQYLGGEGKMLSQHPAIFPRRLAEDHIRTWTNPGDLVLDPMAGSGSTGRAAANLGRRAAMIEVNPGYCDLIRRRMAQQTLC